MIGLSLFRRIWRGAPAPDDALRSEGVGAEGLDIRISASLFRKVRDHVEDFSRGEEAGFLICGVSRSPGHHVLLARDWLPIPPSAITRNSRGSVLAWSAEFNSEAVEDAIDRGCTVVLVHSHGRKNPHFSRDDREKERQLFPGLGVLLDPLPVGSLLLGDGDADGSFWVGGKQGELTFRRIVVLGKGIEIWPSVNAKDSFAQPRKRLARQSRAIGPDADRALANVRVAIVGVSGGGSHFVQQLAHMGVGTLIPVDDQLVDETNLGRLVGAQADDIDATTKVDVARRLAQGIDPSIAVEGVVGRFPEPDVIAALKRADVVVSCVDRFDAREALNAFCRRYLIPQVDIGVEILSVGQRLATADGQIIVSMPDSACMRCWFLTDAVLSAERQRRPPGYDANPNAPGDPQVVSMNGVLASEACNSVLDLITGYAGGVRGGRFWQYDGRLGELSAHPIPSRRSGCPACAEQARGDPSI